MSKMNELSQELDDLISCGEKIIQTAKAIRASFSNETSPAAEPKKQAKPARKEAAPIYSKEDVRAKLASKANEAGGQYKAQVKAIVRKYADGGTLTDIPQDRYADLITEVEGLKDA